MKRMQHEKMDKKRELSGETTTSSRGRTQPPLFSNNYWMILTLKTIVFDVRASMLFPTLFTTHLTNHTAIHPEEGVLG